MDEDDEIAHFVEGMMRGIMATTTDRGKSERTLRRLQAKLHKNFPIGCRVRLTPEAAKRFPKYADAEGTVLRYEHGVSPFVRWDGRKTGSGYHPDFLRRIP